MRGSAYNNLALGMSMALAIPKLLAALPLNLLRTLSTDIRA